MKPYYDHDGITLYHGCCRELLPQLKADIVLTDPPWITSGAQQERRGAGVAPAKQKSRGIRNGAVGQFDAQVIRDLTQQAASHDCFFICGYKELATTCLACDPLRGVFGWHKPNGTPAAAYAAKLDLAFIVWGGRQTYLAGHQHYPSSVFSVSKPSAGCMASERFVDDTGKAVHPCQGPIALYLQILRPFPSGSVVLDPYAGTGTTLRAAKDLGLKAIGVESEERYCELIAKRLGQGVFSWGN